MKKIFMLVLFSAFFNVSSHAAEKRDDVANAKCVNLLSELEKTVKGDAAPTPAGETVDPVKAPLASPTAQ